MAKMSLGWSIRGGFDAEKVNPPSFVNSIGKPVGGIWLSPLTETGTEWTDFCKKEGIDSFLRDNTVYPVEVERNGLYGFRSEPSKEKIERIMKDDAYHGFYVRKVFSGWDVSTVWVKSLDDIEFLTGEELAS